MIDLHTHSTASDGTFAPSALVAEACRSGVTHLALTDHDGVGGLEEARAEAHARGMRFIDGLELSADYQPGTMHILGYGFDPVDAALSEKLAKVLKSRTDRNPKICEKLRELGMDVWIEEVQAYAGGDVVGRPHFARLLVDKGYVKSGQEAFDLYLEKGKPAYVGKEKLSPEDCINLIRGAGGVAVLAHPKQLGAAGVDELESILHRLIGAGLQGIECYYRNHSAEDEELFRGLAEKYGLLQTGGSDFHGQNKPEVKLGMGEGGLKVPEVCWDLLAKACGRTAA